MGDALAPNVGAVKQPHRVRRRRRRGDVCNNSSRVRRRRRRRRRCCRHSRRCGHAARHVPDKLVAEGVHVHHQFVFEAGNIGALVALSTYRDSRNLSSQFVT